MEELSKNQNWIMDFKAWIQVSEGSDVPVTAVVKRTTRLKFAGAIFAESNCWSMLKGGLTVEESGPAELYFERSHISQTITIPSDSLLNELRIVEMEQFLAIHDVSCLNRSSFSQGFIFGSASSAYQGSDFVAKAVDLAARELITSASLGQVTQVQLDRAKVSTKSAVLMNLESEYALSNSHW
ncbi:hypothetical protein D0Y65_024118 [Glycine soja]|nr:hypothetical protein D0Y65_024118 [Glycine soja]